ncbi:L-threonylcarbamoyladenylate synthase [Halodesulfurarchaeum sp.]|uniref:L-threonylcarbamoyladenylate synthase n=1 Tax=Halodesulfurarchaeum sp. TaxID=1980530 RepID=UPI001BC31F80|nr:threonylcarbamoyl-AMP synthase [Halodesulfurarchaeum sp.]
MSEGRAETPRGPIARAADAIQAGDLVVYPTETVYGLGADALDPEAITRVFDAKGRNRSEPISLAVPTPETALSYVSVSERERAFMAEFLPGPVTVVMAKRAVVPDALTAGEDRVGIRVPDHDLAHALLDAVEPITATSANVSGRPSVTDPDSLDSEIRAAAAEVLDGGETGGTGSTVVDVERGEIHRDGPLVADIEAWLQAHP